MCRLIQWKNGQSLADIKYKYIENIAREAEKCKNINRIMLFGSSLEERCTSASDIDIAVFGNQKRSKYLRSKEFMTFQDNIFLYDLEQEYDILYFCEGVEQKTGILEDINKGIEIYRRAAV